jgi:hypothetical protein
VRQIDKLLSRENLLDLEQAWFARHEPGNQTPANYQPEQSDPNNRHEPQFMVVKQSPNKKPTSSNKPRLIFVWFGATDLSRLVRSVINMVGPHLARRCNQESKGVVRTDKIKNSFAIKN